MKKQVMVAVVSTIIAGAITASAKSIVDVKVLKAKVESLFDVTKDTNDRIKRIEHLMMRGR